jgi:hypothetical protein
VNLDNANLNHELVRFMFSAPAAREYGLPEYDPADANAFEVILRKALTEWTYLHATHEHPWGEVLDGWVRRTRDVIGAPGWLVDQWRSRDLTATELYFIARADMSADSNLMDLRRAANELFEQAVDGATNP